MLAPNPYFVFILYRLTSFFLIKKTQPNSAAVWPATASSGVRLPSELSVKVYKDKFENQLNWCWVKHKTRQSKCSSLDFGFENLHMWSNLQLVCATCYWGPSWLEIPECLSLNWPLNLYWKRDDRAKIHDNLDHKPPHFTWLRNPSLMRNSDYWSVTRFRCSLISLNFQPFEIKTDEWVNCQDVTKVTLVLLSSNWQSYMKHLSLLL